MKGENPYDMRLVRREAEEGGDNPANLLNTSPPPAVYLPTVLPLVAGVAWLPWKAARFAWSLVSVGVFLFSVVAIFRTCTLSGSQRWVLGAGVLLFSPTSSGLSTGNPSVVSCAFTLAAIFLALEHRVLAAAVVLGLAHSVKPQVSIAGLAILLGWGYWRAAGLSLVVPVFAGCASYLRAASFKTSDSG